LGDLNLEGFDAAHMDDLGGIPYEFLAAHMDFLAENEVSDGGEDTVGGDSEDEGYFKGKGTRDPGTPEFITGARVVYIGQGGDEIHLGYVVEVHVDGGGGSLYYTVNLEGIGEKQTEGHRLFPVASDSQEKLSPPDPPKAPSNTTSKSSQSKKDRKAEKSYLKQMSELAKNVQQQRLENNKLEKLFSDSKKKSLHISLALSQKQENVHVDPWDRFVATEVTGSYYAVSRGGSFYSLGIYADVKMFVMEVNGMVGDLFKVCESYSEARLCLEEHFTKGNYDPTGYRFERNSFLVTRGGVSPPSHTTRNEEKRPFQGHHVRWGRVKCDEIPFER
jgi:hypothetical protein